MAASMGVNLSCGCFSSLVGVGGSGIGRASARCSRWRACAAACAAANSSLVVVGGSGIGRESARSNLQKKDNGGVCGSALGRALSCPSDVVCCPRRCASLATAGRQLGGLHHGCFSSASRRPAPAPRLARRTRSSAAVRGCFSCASSAAVRSSSSCAGPLQRWPTHRLLAAGEDRLHEEHQVAAGEAFHMRMAWHSWLCGHVLPLRSGRLVVGQRAAPDGCHRARHGRPQDLRWRS